MSRPEPRVDCDVTGMPVSHHRHHLTIHPFGGCNARLRLRREGQMTIHVSETIGRPRSEVWAAATDWDRAPRWMKGVQDMHVLSEGPVGEGATLGFNARGSERETTIVTWNPGALLALRSRQGGRNRGLCLPFRGLRRRHEGHPECRMSRRGAGVAPRVTPHRMVDGKGRRWSAAGAPGNGREHRVAGIGSHDRTCGIDCPRTKSRSISYRSRSNAQPST